MRTTNRYTYRVGFTDNRPTLLCWVFADNLTDFMRILAHSHPKLTCMEIVSITQETI